MRKIYSLGLFLIGLFGLNGCHGMAGNVIPQSGPSMEDVYDSMKNNPQTISSLDNSSNTETDLDSIRQNQNQKTIHSSSTGLNTFHQLPNPELKLYMYPHFAGTDEIPIPGYYTVFNAYEKTHYALTSETIR